MALASVVKSSIANPDARARIRRALGWMGYSTTDWVRVVAYERCFAFVRSLDPKRLDVMEISGGPQWRRAFDFRSYRDVQFPEFDICADSLDQCFDLIIADQVFEHLPFPYRAGQNVHSMLRPGGWFVVVVPFLIRIHASPIDCSRWTEQGLRFMLQECGFPAEHIVTGSWGNRACVKANFNRWRRYGWRRSLRNEPNFPVMVWAFAQSAPTPAADFVSPNVLGASTSAGS